MQALHNFIEINMTPLIFAYGLAYFTAGLAILFQSRGLSNFRLARNLWLVGMFGIIHGASEWGDIFIPIQADYLSGFWVDVLAAVRDIMRAVSYAFLLQFGIAMIVSKLPWAPRVRAFVRWYAVFWSTAVTLAGGLFLPADLGESWVRYLLCFPAAVLTAAAFFAERQPFDIFENRSVRNNLTVTAAVFGLYAVLGGLVIPQPAISFLSWLDYENVRAFTGLPIQVWRMVLGFAIAIYVIRTLSVFDLEVRHRLEASEREKALLQDRQRIARDLHDGVVQSIYAAGLQLEAASRSHQNETGASEACLIVHQVINQLNDVIADIRKYIFNLSSARNGETDFDVYMRDMVNEFTSCGHFSAMLSIEGERAPLTPGQKQNLAFVTRECLSNIVKHAEASEVELRLVFDADSLFFVVEDNGVGIDEDALVPANGGRGRGLRSLAERAAAMNGDFSISRRLEKGGTVMIMRIPYSKGVK